MAAKSRHGVFLLLEMFIMKKSAEIRVLMVEPGEKPKETFLKTDLDSLQKAVSIGCEEQGLIEIVPIGKKCSILCHECGKLIGLPGNRRIGNDIVAGVFYVFGDTPSGGMRSLTDKEFEHWSNVFEEPEYYTDTEVTESIMLKFFGL